jgi:hypothetical protein
MKLKIDYSSNKKCPTFKAEYREVSEKYGPQGQIERTMTKDCKEGEYIKGKCKIFSKFKEMLGIKKDVNGIKCKNMKFFECAKKGLKRISCGKGRIDEEGSHWEQNCRVERTPNNNFGCVPDKKKPKKKIVYKDEHGNIICPEQIKNGAYIRMEKPGNNPGN